MNKPAVSQDVWLALATNLGLEFESAGSYLYGDREGHRVVCTAARGAEWTVYELAIAFRRPFDVAGGVLTDFDPAALDAAEWSARDELVRSAIRRAKALVGHPPSPSLSRLRGLQAEVSVRDDRLLVARRADGCSPQLLADVLAQGVTFANSLEERRAAVPVRAELAHMDGPFRSTAAELSIAFSPCPLGLAGEIDGVAVRAGTAQRDRDWWIVVAADFPRKPPLEVNIGPHVKTLAERFFLSSPDDDEIGDRMLDDALEVATDSPDELRRRLSTVHASLRALVAAGELAIAQNVVLTAKAPEASFGELVRNAAAIAAALADTRDRGSPFR